MMLLLLVGVMAAPTDPFALARAEAQKLPERATLLVEIALAGSPDEARKQLAQMPPGVQVVGGYLRLGDVAAAEAMTAGLPNPESFAGQLTTAWLRAGDSKRALAAARRLPLARRLPALSQIARHRVQHALPADALRVTVDAAPKDAPALKALMLATAAGLADRARRKAVIAAVEGVATDDATRLAVFTAWMSGGWLTEARRWAQRIEKPALVSSVDARSSPARPPLTALVPGMPASVFTMDGAGVHGMVELVEEADTLLREGRHDRLLALAKRVLSLDVADDDAVEEDGEPEEEDAETEQAECNLPDDDDDRVLFVIELAYTVADRSLVLLATKMIALIPDDEERGEQQAVWVQTLVEQGRFRAALALAKAIVNPDPNDVCDAERWTGPTGQEALADLAELLTELQQFALALDAIGAMEVPPAGDDELEEWTNWTHPVETAIGLVSAFHEAGRLPALVKRADGEGDLGDDLLLEVVSTLSAAGDISGARAHLARIETPVTRVRALIRVGTAIRAGRIAP